MPCFLHPTSYGTALNGFLKHTPGFAASCLRPLILPYWYYRIKSKCLIKVYWAIHDYLIICFYSLFLTTFSCCVLQPHGTVGFQSALTKTHYSVIAPSMLPSRGQIHSMCLVFIGWMNKSTVLYTIICLHVGFSVLACEPTQSSNVCAVSGTS